MTVHARHVARLCRERLTRQGELPVLKQQPEQQHAAGTATPAPTAAAPTGATTEEEAERQPAS